MADKKEEVKAKKQALNVEITASGANGKDGPHKVGDVLKIEGDLPKYLINKCRVLANGQA